MEEEVTERLGVDRWEKRGSRAGRSRETGGGGCEERAELEHDGERTQRNGGLNRRREGRNAQP